MFLEEDDGGACRTLSRCSSEVVANEAPVHSCGGWVEGGGAQRERRLWSGLQGGGGGVSPAFSNLEYSEVRLWFWFLVPTLQLSNYSKRCRSDLIVCLDSPPTHYPPPHCTLRRAPAPHGVRVQPAPEPTLEQ